ncbi:MAG: quinone-dependent dihydroorotate dehydrogenase [Planctomycetota bacterium]
MSKFTWNTLIRPIFFQLPAETAHHAAMGIFARTASVPAIAAQIRRRYEVVDPRLEVEQFGLRFPNPIGLAAGFDKAGAWYHQLMNLGFGSVEIGTVTGQAQPGNPKPRLFRLPADRAIVNRMGFNSDGCQAVAAELNKKSSKATLGILGINIGKSKVIPLEEAPAEHQKSFEALFEYADYFTINVSSPNTPNLRELQNKDHLIDIISAVQQSNQKLSHQLGVKTKPILLKIAPDCSDNQLAEIAEVAIDQKLSAIIATNTTISRDGLNTGKKEVEKIGAGGLSGRPLTDRSREVIGTLYKRLRNRIPLVGVGGIMNGNDAWNMITAGANLLQIYTGFIYGGPSLIREINQSLLTKIEAAGVDSICDVVGIEHR